MDYKLLIILFLIGTVPLFTGVMATDLTIQKDTASDDLLNYTVYTNSYGVDQFWVDENGFVYANGTLVTGGVGGNVSGSGDNTEVAIWNSTDITSYDWFKIFTPQQIIQIEGADDTNRNLRVTKGTVSGVGAGLASFIGGSTSNRLTTPNNGVISQVYGDSWTGGAIRSALNGKMDILGGTDYAFVVSGTLNTTATGGDQVAVWGSTTGYGGAPIWGMATEVIMEDNPANAVGLEVSVEPNVAGGTPRGVHIIGKGTNNGENAIHVNSEGGVKWTRGLYIDDNSIDSSGYVIDTNSFTVNPDNTITGNNTNDYGRMIADRTSAASAYQIAYNWPDGDATFWGLTETARDDTIHNDIIITNICVTIGSNTLNGATVLNFRDDTASVVSVSVSAGSTAETCTTGLNVYVESGSKISFSLDSSASSSGSFGPTHGFIEYRGVSN